MHLYLIKAGFFYCTGGAMFGIIPQKIWGKRYPATGEMCRMGMNLALVEMSGRKILIDTGVGLKYPDRCKAYGFESVVDLAEELINIGVKPDEVTDVILTHLHFDHCGGCSVFDTKGNLKVAFPNAIHWVSREQWEHSQSPTLLDEDAYWPENIQPIADAGLLQLVDSDQEIYPGFRLELFQGHTPGQIVPFFELNNQSICFTGDVIPTSAHVSKLWISAYDLYPVDSVTEKLRLLEKAETENCILITPHDAFHQTFTVQRTGGIFKIKGKSIVGI